MQRKMKNERNKKTHKAIYPDGYMDTVYCIDDMGSYRCRRTNGVYPKRKRTADGEDKQ